MEGQYHLFDYLEEPFYKIHKPVRLIELFGGIGSQAIFTCPNNNNSCGCGCGNF